MFTEDLSPFFDTTTGFAQTATVAGQSVAVLFGDAYAAGNVGMLGMAGNQPAITLKTADVPASPLGATVVVNATTYLVAAHEPNGSGVSRLILESAA